MQKADKHAPVESERGAQQGGTGATPLHQRLVQSGMFLLGGVLFLGALLDALSNAIAIINPPVAIGGTVGLMVLWLVAKYLVAVLKPSWRSKSGRLVRIKKLGWKSLLPLTGMILLLWVPLLFEPKTQVAMAGESERADGEPVKVILYEGQGSASISFQCKPTERPCPPVGELTRRATEVAKMYAMSDVAGLAGVSLDTVSNVLSGRLENEKGRYGSSVFLDKVKIVEIAQDGDEMKVTINARVRGSHPRNQKEE